MNKPVFDKDNTPNMTSQELDTVIAQITAANKKAQDANLENFKTFIIEKVDALAATTSFGNADGVFAKPFMTNMLEAVWNQMEFEGLSDRRAEISEYLHSVVEWYRKEYQRFAKFTFDRCYKDMGNKD